MMKICAAIDDVNEIPLTSNADMVELDIDLFESLSEKIEKPLIIKVTDRRRLFNWKDPIDNGFIDIGEFDPPYRTNLKVISSLHDMNRSMTSDEIVEALNSFEGDLVKGVFRIIRPVDLISLHEASKSLNKPHILLGKGEMGIVTRLRSKVLNNEFIYAHTGKAKDIDQLTTEDMKTADEDCTLFGLISHPIKNRLLKNMISQAMADAGIKGYYLNFDVTTIEYMDEVIRRYDIKGMNVSLPFKKDIMAYTDSLDRDAAATGMVNLLHNTGSKIIGSNTDVYGIDFALKRSETEIGEGTRVIVMGTGGVARSSVHYMMEKGAEVTIAGRNEVITNNISKQFGCSKIVDSDPTRYDIIVNCTPVDSVEALEYPIDLSKITSDQMIMDITMNNDSALRAAGRNNGCKDIPGVDVFIGQGMRSFETWTGKTPDYESMKRALFYK